jgi:hypothetical protein
LLRPYKFHKNGGIYEFITRNGVRYDITIHDRSLSWRYYIEKEIIVLDISFFPENEPDKCCDYHILDTISDFCITVLQKNSDVVLTWITADGDGKSKQRGDRFNRQINKYNPEWVDFEVIQIQGLNNEVQSCYMVFVQDNHDADLLRLAMFRYYRDNYS